MKQAPLQLSVVVLSLAASLVSSVGCGEEETSPPRTSSSPAHGRPGSPANAPPGSPAAPAASGAPSANVEGSSVSTPDAGDGATAPASGFVPLVIPTGSVVHYVDSQAGNDDADGASEATAWRTLDKVSAADVQGGEFVLFKRGQTFAGGVRPARSGQTTRPIVFSAYGTGPRPVLDGGFQTYSGFELSDREHVVVRDLEITRYSGPGVHVDRAVDVFVYNSVITFTGGDESMSAIHGNDAHYVRAERLTMTDITGDVFGVWGGDHLSVLDSFITRISGASADGVHIAWASDIEVRGNWMDMTGTTSGKGLMCICEDERAVIAQNVLIGGNYGVGMQGNDFVVEDNWVEDNNHAPWSYSIAWGGQEGVPTDMHDFVAKNNVIVRGRNGIASFYNNVDGTKNNLQAFNNTFIDTEVSFASWGATFVNSAMHDNTLYNTPEGTGPGLNVFANQNVSAPPPNQRPTMAGRGAF